MRKQCFGVGVAALALLLGSVPAVGQTRPLAPMPPKGLPVTPFMEGWYENEDGSYTISFGYLNRNRSEVIRIEAGPNNLLEPSQFSGMQPTVFLPGRHRGVFAVTIPGSMAGQDLWWTITNRNGEVHKVPGRVTAHSYELDRNPRPAGSLPPRVAFSENGPWGWDPSGITADEVVPARVGERVTLSLWADDPSQRDPEDPRYETAKPLRVVWSLFQAPAVGEVTFARHESTPVQETDAGEDDEGPRRTSPPGPEEIMLPEGEGLARVYATFTEPGEYVLRAQVDNWRAPDSSSGDQCCWSNGFVRVNVSP